MIQKKNTHVRTIEELQEVLGAILTRAQELQASGSLPPGFEELARIAPPPGFTAKVSLRHKDGDRQIKKTANITSWDASKCGVWIEYAPASDSVSSDDAMRTTPNADETAHLQSLVRHLDAVERDARWRFTSWTWLRDQYLPKHGWLLAKDATQLILKRAVDLEIVRTGKVDNPKQPDFPVTSLTLERAHPLVHAVLDPRAAKLDFSPKPLAGKPLSEMIIEDRR